MSIGKSPLVAIALALAIFVTGIGAGIAVDRLWLTPDRVERGGRHGPPSADRVLRMFQRRLKLDADQAEAIGKILEDLDTDMQAIHEQFEPAKKKVFEQTRARILEILTPEQAAEYEKIIAQQEQRRGKRKGNHRRTPGPNRHGPGR